MHPSARWHHQCQVRGALFQRRSSGQLVWALAASNEVIKTIRRSMDELLWPAATAIFIATTHTHTQAHTVSEGEVLLLHQKDHINENSACVCV